MSPKTISASAAEAEFGIVTRHEAMPNGERRFRLLDRDGFGYIRTEAGAEGGWQNSHVHFKLLETYVVQQGWIGVARLVDGEKLELRLLRSGEIWTASVDEAHNVYMPAQSVTHVVKHGELANAGDDWNTDVRTLRLDELTKVLTEEAILTTGS